jgi:hypothetical protein
MAVCSVFTSKHSVVFGRVWDGPAYELMSVRMTSTWSSRS